MTEEERDQAIKDFLYRTDCKGNSGSSERQVASALREMSESQTKTEIKKRESKKKRKEQQERKELERSELE
jgi:hypothetical protein